jgi:hypothetical protein
MRKSSFIILIVMLVSGLYGQEFKFIGGVNTSEYITGNHIHILLSDDPISAPLNDDSYCKWEYKSGFLSGAGVEYPINKKISIEIDVLYFQRGSKLRLADMPNWEKIYSLAVISFPILIKIKPYTYTSPYIVGGGEFSIVLSHKDEVIYDDNVTINNIRRKTKSCYTGLVFGGGFEIKLLKFFVFIEGRYHLGLNDIQKEIRHWESMRTNSMAFIVGFKI